MTQDGAQPETTDPFFGTWVLDPTQSVYEAGQPPQSGAYRIDPEGDSLKFTMDWVAANGQHHEMVYYTIADGKEYAYENSAITDAISTTRIDAHRLDTISKKNGRIIAIGSRVLSAEGLTMTVTQTSIDENGQRYNNVSVYTKRGEQS
jgi:hypothetical protein